VAPDERNPFAERVAGAIRRGRDMQAPSNSTARPAAPRRRESAVVVRQHETTLRCEIARTHEADSVLLGIGPQHPGDLLQLAKGRMLRIHVTIAESHWKREALLAAGLLVALDDLIALCDASDDGGKPAGMAQRRLAVLHRAATNRDAHWNLRYFIGHLLLEGDDRRRGHDIPVGALEGKAKGPRRVSSVSDTAIAFDSASHLP
jgi:hypothetical protein